MRFENPYKAQGKKLVVIVGGGFAGLNAAKELADRSEVHVVLIDQRNHHLFQPLLYQVATAGLNPADIAAPIRSQFSDSRNVEVHLGRVRDVNLKEKLITIQSSDPAKDSSTEPHEIEFDYLILACGAQHSYFGHSEWEQFAPGLKTLEQATEIRRRILLAFEDAENETDDEKRRALMTFAVVGGGATGVELAGAIADIARTVLQYDFKRIDPTKSRVLLIEAGPRVLAAFEPELSEHAKNDLRDLGVEVRVNTRVENIDAESVSVGVGASHERIATRTAFWAAGVQATHLNFVGGTAELDRAGRVKVQKDFSIPGAREVFVVGDMASFDLGEGKLLPGLAPVAIQSGKLVAKNIVAEIEGEPRKDFKYFDKGQMATIGKNRAVLQSGGFTMTGHFAWLAWLLIHIFYLIGFKNRIAVLASWAWSYLFSKRGARLITQRDWHLKT